MARKKLTAVFVEKVQPPKGKPQEDYFDTLIPAFGLRVGQRKKAYFVMARVLRNGEWKMSRATLGTTTELTLQDAREAARNAIEQAQQGKDPAEVKRGRRESQKAESRNTFASVRADFLRLYRTRQKRKPSPRTLDELRRVLESDLFADWNDRPLTAITRRDVMDMADTLVEQGKETAANRYLTYLKMMFGWSRKRGIIKVDPTADVDKPGTEQSRARVLSPNELRAIWHATAPTQQNKGDLFASIVKVLMLTGQRRNEVAGMRWPEVDLDSAMWSLPGSRTKNHRDHLIPLSRPVLDILRERQREQANMTMDTDLVFTSTGKTPFSGWSRSKNRLDGRANIEPWTLHDLRRSVVTLMSEDLYVAPHVIEAVVNHVSGVKSGVAGVYNRALYLDERRRALDAWADHIRTLTTETVGSNVVLLSGSKA